MRLHNKKNKIKFICEEESLAFWPKPIPASKMLPKWYKDTPSYVDGKKEYAPNGTVSATIKKCMPVFDAITSGYLLLLPSDVYVKRENNEITFMPSVQKQLITEHVKGQAPTLDVPEEYGPEFFKWKNPWIIRTPKNYSVLFTQPLHRYDLPFFILPGVVDTDSFDLSVQFPFLLRKGFEGLIPAGTPIAQVLPFERNYWESEFDIQTSVAHANSVSKHFSFFENTYKKTVWTKKEYK